MLGSLANLLKGFGVGSTPNTTVLSVVDNQNGTCTATISGSTTGAVNTVYGLFNGSTAVSMGSRTGDGTVPLTTVPGRYIFYVISVLALSSSISNLVELFVGFTTSILGHSPANIIRWLLVQLGQVSNPSLGGDWPGYESAEPPNPDSVVTCYNNGTGLVEGFTEPDSEAQEHPGVQIRVRAPRAPDCYSKIKSIVGVLDQQVKNVGVTVESSSYLVHCLSRTGTILDLKKVMPGTQRLSVMTINYNVSLVQLA